MLAGRDAARILGWLLIYLGMTIWLTWPLAAQLGHNLPCTDNACSFDTVYSAWVMSWLSQSRFPGRSRDIAVETC